MKATPLQLTPRTTTSGTIRSRSTQNNDLYGGARPREDVLAARVTIGQDPRYPSAAHISRAASCLWSDANDDTLGMDRPFRICLESPRLQDLQNINLNTNNAPLRPSTSLIFLIDCFLFVLLLVSLVRESKGKVESQSANEFNFLIAKRFDSPIIDKFDSPTVVELDSPTVIEFDLSIAKFDAPFSYVSLSNSTFASNSIAEFGFSYVSNSTFNTRIQRSMPNARHSTTDFQPSTLDVRRSTLSAIHITRSAEKFPRSTVVCLVNSKHYCNAPFCPFACAGVTGRQRKAPPRYLSAVVSSTWRHRPPSSAAEQGHRTTIGSYTAIFKRTSTIGSLSRVKREGKGGVSLVNFVGLTDDGFDFQNVAAFEFSIAKFESPIVDESDFQVVVRLDPSIVAKFDSPVVVEFDSPIAVKFDSSISEFDSESSLSSLDGSTTVTSPTSKAGHYTPTVSKSLNNFHSLKINTLKFFNYRLSQAHQYNIRPTVAVNRQCTPTSVEGTVSGRDEPSTNTDREYNVKPTPTSTASAKSTATTVNRSCDDNSHNSIGYENSQTHGRRSMLEAPRSSFTRAPPPFVIFSPLAPTPLHAPLPVQRLASDSNSQLSTSTRQRQAQWTSVNSQLQAHRETKTTSSAPLSSDCTPTPTLAHRFNTSDHNNNDSMGVVVGASNKGVLSPVFYVGPTGCNEHQSRNSNQPSANARAIHSIASASPPSQLRLASNEQPHRTSRTVRLPAHVTPDLFQRSSPTTSEQRRPRSWRISYARC